MHTQNAGSNNSYSHQKVHVSDCGLYMCEVQVLDWGDKHLVRHRTWSPKWPRYFHNSWIDWTGHQSQINDGIHGEIGGDSLCDWALSAATGQQ